MDSIRFPWAMATSKYLSRAWFVQSEGTRTTRVWDGTPFFFRYRHRPVPSPTSGQLVQQNRGAAMLTLPLVGASSSERGFASLPRHPSRRLEEKAGHVAGSEDGARDLPAGQAIGLDRPAGRRDRLHRTERRFPGSAVRRKRTTDSWRMPPGIEIR